MRRNMQSVLALFREKVSLFKASGRLPLNSSLLELGVRSYMTCHARVLTISDKEKISYAKQCGSYSFKLIKSHFRQFLH
jgi:hypothetical protein